MVKLQGYVYIPGHDMDIVMKSMGVFLAICHAV